eukprot:TRINITY_DN8986_c0_g1_i1.p1 TRINITY_DN8986_c0_g1~~TRINITY_DN8986_c0_g1_i1.p1  ORF type:complete len:123 (-),score=2.66 TRINITY_DN8986_c0_g1_i1:92-460(-)
MDALNAIANCTSSSGDIVFVFVLFVFGGDTTIIFCLFVQLLFGVYVACLSVIPWPYVAIFGLFKSEKSLAINCRITHVLCVDTTALRSWIVLLFILSTYFTSCATQRNKLKLNVKFLTSTND